MSDKKIENREVGLFRIYEGRFYHKSWSVEELNQGDAPPVFNKFTEVVDRQTLECLQEVPIPSGRDESTGIFCEEGFYYKDKNHVYFDTEMNPEIIEDALVSDFQYVGGEGYPFLSQSGGQFFLGIHRVAFDPRAAKDLGGGCYYLVGEDCYYSLYGSPIKSLDVETFTVLEPETVGFIGKDKKNVFFKNQIIEGADPETFAFLDGCVGKNRKSYMYDEYNFYAKDAHRAYFLCATSNFAKVIETKSLDSFRFYVDPDKDDYGFAEDETYIYDAGKRRSKKPTSSKRSVEEIKEGMALIEHDGVVLYGTFQEKVYSLTQLLSAEEYEELDVVGRYVVQEDLEKLPKSSFVIERDSSRFVASPLQGSDGETFKVHSPHWSSDKTGVYLYGKRKKEIDPITFRHLQFVNALHDYACDKNFVYDINLFKKMTNVDVQSFELVDKFWAKDRDGYIFLGQRKRVKGVDESSFRVTSEDGDAEDNLRTYSYDSEADKFVIRKKKS